MKYYLSFVFVFLSFISFGQNAKYGKVSLDELRSKRSTIDSTAAAEILEKNVYIYIDQEYRLHTEVFMRIKIYDKQKAEEQLGFSYRCSIKDDITFKAITFNEENGKIVETNLEKSQQFTSTTKKAKAFRTTYPNVKNGSIVDYKFTVASNNLDCRQQFYQYQIPLKNGKYYIEFPEIIYYNIDMRGVTAPKSHKTNNIRWNDKYNAHTFEVQYENVPPVPDEEYVINKYNSRTSLKLSLKGVVIPGSVYENFAETWDNFAEFIMKHEDFGLQFLKPKSVKEEVIKVIGNETDTMQIVKKLFTHVQKNYTWNKDENLIADEGVDKCLETKKGNSAELNILLISMLQAANVQAYPFILSTIDNGIINPSIPSLYAVDYVITAVKTQKGIQLMDASHKYSQINLLPKKCLNQWGFVIEKGKAVLQDIKNKLESRYYYSTEASIDENLNLKVTATNVIGSFEAMDLLLEYTDKSSMEKAILPMLDNYKDSIKIVEKNGNIDIKYNVKTDGLIDQLDQKLIFNPLFYNYSSSNPFELEKRVNSIEFGSPFSTVKKGKITIPAGYKVADMPKSKKVVFENVGELKYVIQANAQEIEVVSTFRLLRESFLVEELQALRDLWRQRIEAEGQLLSLVKE